MLARHGHDLCLYGHDPGVEGYCQFVRRHRARRRHRCSWRRISAHGKPERVQKTFRSSLVLMLAMGLLSGLVMYLTAGATVGFMLGAYSGTGL